MADKNERVAEMVRAELSKNPQIGNDVLMKQATAMDAKIKRMSPRQFHATYRLPVVRAAKRAANPGKKRAGRPAKTGIKRSARRVAAPAAPAAETQSAPSEPAIRRRVTISRGREHEAVRQILHGVATEALRADDRAAFVQVLDNLDARTVEVLSLFGR